MISEIREVHREYHLNYQGDIEKIKHKYTSTKLPKRGVDFNKIRTSTIQNEYHFTKHQSKQIEQKQYNHQNTQSRISNSSQNLHKEEKNISSQNYIIIIILLIVSTIVGVYIMGFDYTQKKQETKINKTEPKNRTKINLFQTFSTLQRDDSNKWISLNQFQRQNYVDQQTWTGFILEIANNQNCQVRKVNQNSIEDSLIHCTLNDL